MPSLQPGYQIPNYWVHDYWQINNQYWPLVVVVPPYVLINDIQTAIIGLLESDSTVATEFGDEIREDFWAGEDWDYPALRVAVGSLHPTTEGKCHLDCWTVLFSILIYTQPTVSDGLYDTSSRGCMELMGSVKDALLGERPREYDKFANETAIEIEQQIGPSPHSSPGGWLGEVICKFGLKST